MRTPSDREALQAEVCGARTRYRSAGKAKHEAHRLGGAHPGSTYGSWPCPFADPDLPHWHAGPLDLEAMENVAAAMRGLEEPAPHDPPTRERRHRHRRAPT